MFGLLMLMAVRAFKALCRAPERGAEQDDLGEKVGYECWRSKRMIIVNDGVLCSSSDQRQANEETINVALAKLDSAIRLDVPVQLTPKEALTLRTNVSLLTKS